MILVSCVLGVVSTALILFSNYLGFRRGFKKGAHFVLEEWKKVEYLEGEFKDE